MGDNWAAWPSVPSPFGSAFMCRHFPLWSALCLTLFSWSVLGQESKRYYLGVGVEDYEHESLRKPPLKYCVDDVTTLAEVLKERGYVVKLLTDDTGKQDKQALPTKANIDREVKIILDAAKRGDAVVLAFAGHGLQFAGDKESYFCPLDARPLKARADSLVSTKSIYEAMEASHASSRILLVDACRNDPDPTRGRGIDPVSAPPPRGVAVFFSCDAGQKALEQDKLGHGVFFHHLIEGLSGKAADRDTQTVTTNSLASHVADGVEKDTDGAQQPVFDSKQVGKPFVFVDLRDSEPSTRLTAGTVREFTDLKIKFCYCPPGKFLMGSPRDERHRQEDEDSKTGEGGEQVEVAITKGFWLGQTEITHKQWFDLMGTKPWPKEHNLSNFPKEEGDKVAASFISYRDAIEFCSKLTELERSVGRLMPNQRYTLPTEAQWEYACRAATVTRYSFGDDEGGLIDFGMNHGLSDYNGIDYASAVGRKKPNPWKLHDMHGNCTEWCLDAYRDHLDGGSDPCIKDEGESSLFVARDGRWSSDTSYLRCASRYGIDPAKRDELQGFRLSRTE